jgi:hypothetical protein
MDALTGNEDVVQQPDFEAAAEKTWLAWVPTDSDVPATSGRRRAATDVQRERLLTDKRRIPLRSASVRVGAECGPDTNQ